MKIKLDENIGTRGKILLIEAGYDVATIFEENLQSAPDTTVIKVCQNEGRCLVTLDLDFSNPLQFNPAQYMGIAVLRLSNPLNSMELLDIIKTLINALKQEQISGKLWIVQRGRIRIYQPEN